MPHTSNRFRNLHALIATAVLGALNDNLLKAALIVYAATHLSTSGAATVGLAAGGLLMLPFVLFSGWAGILSDRFEKARMIRMLKWSELGISALAIGALALGSIPALLGIVFLMGTQSAFFGPLKTGWLPERLDPRHLVTANGALETGTFLAILGGTVAGGLLSGMGTLVWTGAASISVALIGLAAAHLLPTGQPAAPEMSVPRNPLSSTTITLKALFADRIASRAAILSCWFWAAGSVYLSTLPAYLRQQLGADETLLTLVMALFAIGVGAGSVVAAIISRGKPTARMVVPSVVIMALASFGLYAGFDQLTPGSGIAGLLGTGQGLFVVASLFFIAFGGGIFSVPLMAIMQSRSEADQRGQVMAGFNILSAIGITLSSAAMSLGVKAGLGIDTIFLVVAISSILLLIGSALAFPRAALQGLGYVLFKAWFRIEIVGRENLATDGAAVYVANHSSFADGPLLFSIIDRDVSIAVDTGWAKGALLGKLIKTLKIAPLDPTRPMAAKGLAQEIRDGGAALIFPEGRITTHGALMKVYPGTAWLVDAAQAPVVPISIEGLDSSVATRPIAGLARRIFPKVRIRVGEPTRLEVAPELKGRLRREAATRALHQLLETSRFESLSAAGTIPHAFYEACKVLDPKGMALTDPMGAKLTRRKIALGAAAFSAILQKRTEPGENVGVLLPSAAGAAVVLMGLWRAGRVAAILNPTLGPSPMMSAIETAGIHRILTSRDFVEKAGITDLLDQLEAKGVEILWTDDIKAGIKTSDKLRAMWAARRPTDVCLSFNDPAVVLFTSGTEGAPKGVVLTHGNLVANVAQLRARTDVSSADRVLSALPLFHSFGLTAGVLLPLMAGAPVMLYPSPLHYRIVPEVAYAHQATLIFGTDTFLSGWGRRASAYDFSTVRAAVAGAEAVKPATRSLWADKFGVRILEGYGATEAGPVIALNTPMENRPGTVGRALPGIEMQLEDVPGVEGKRLSIAGPNVMAGYLLHGKPGLHAPADGWYDTGDIVQIAEDGFISIVGRAKRFAKVGGEMVSLAAAEALGADVWPDAHVAAISVPDTRKGERVILVTDQADAERSTLSAAAKAAGIAEITVPSEVMVMDKIPLLASGKTDYPALGAIVLSGSEVAA